MGTLRMEGKAGQTERCGVKAGTVLYASDGSDAALAEARAWISERRLTRDDVKLVKRDGQVLVVAEREVRV